VRSAERRQSRPDDRSRQTAFPLLWCDAFNMRPRFNTRPFNGDSYRMITGPFNNSAPNKDCPAKTCHVNIYYE
jgi:hypothetical protein